MSIEQLKIDVVVAQRNLATAKSALEAFESLAENNVFATVDEARVVIENALLCKAHEDCEGSYNCGDDSYTQEFMVGGIVYIATLAVEYNRHDKTYYYIDGSEFSVRAMG